MSNNLCFVFIDNVYFLLRKSFLFSVYFFLVGLFTFVSNSTWERYIKANWISIETVNCKVSRGGDGGGVAWALLICFTFSVTVHVVHLERHAELFLGVSLSGHRNGDEEFGKVDRPTAVSVEHFEDVVTEFVRFALRVKCFVGVDELLLV